MKLNREQTRERIAQDDGDPTATVWLTPRSPGRYHGSRECQSVQWCEEPTALAREQAQQTGHPPCAKCVLDTASADNTGQTLTGRLARMSPADAGLSETPPPGEEPPTAPPSRRGAASGVGEGEADADD